MRRRTAWLALAAVLVLPACGDSAASGGEERLTVFAAASLSDVFDRLGGRFRDEHPEVELTLNYGGSASLARAIAEGAPVDVFASADEAQMAAVADRTAEPEVFASNVLAIAVPTGNPAKVTGLADFAREDLTLAVCAPQVPCGAAAERLFDLAGVTAAPDTLEDDVRAALTKVELGEADAALVYASDVRTSQAVDGVAVPEADQVVNRYPIARLADAENPDAAQDFVDLVLSADGARALADHGFRVP